MANIIYKNILKLEIIKLKSEYDAISSIQHNPTKGNFREYGLGSLLKKYLPLGWDIGQGIITDSYGNQSAQSDIIIYRKDVLPSIMFGNTNGIYPIESVAFVIEVKSRSEKNELKTTLDKMNKLNNLRTIDDINAFKYCKKCYFAYISDLKGKNEFERFIDIDQSPYIEPSIDIICVLGDGYYYYKNEYIKNKEAYRVWQGKRANENDIEIKLFLLGIINSITGKYKLGYYSIDDSNMDYFYYKNCQNELEFKLNEINIYNYFMNYFENDDHGNAINYLNNNCDPKRKNKIFKIAYDELKNVNQQYADFYHKEITED